MLSCPGNPASWWTGDLWAKSVALILANFNTCPFPNSVFFLHFCGSLVVANQPTGHHGGVSRGRVVAVAVDVSNG